MHLLTCENHDTPIAYPATRWDDSCPACEEIANAQKEIDTLREQVKDLEQQLEAE